ncbi:hypothetical protein BDK51DRAFT_50380 [Blyttiomyces helicus]|uniref:PIH1D1/2/3 CS-like domain-containing protein n=1 Tax=Blyttiomyces helicus TaxID=388810 RepID=A0A4V1IQR5_9FUNG|nr:hypothetical protein BDK51DRAFT_50380 [Blyttiomyces helicus]|eukprot:RKO87477.1 hypothetical protein BDK51DRAFT_50380 [Blyttiomyces helicus]
MRKKPISAATSLRSKKRRKPRKKITSALEKKGGKFRSIDDDPDESDDSEEDDDSDDDDDSSDDSEDAEENETDDEKAAAKLDSSDAAAPPPPEQKPVRQRPTSMQSRGSSSSAFFRVAEDDSPSEGEGSDDSLSGIRGGGHASSSSFSIGRAHGPSAAVAAKAKKRHHDSIRLSHAPVELTRSSFDLLSSSTGGFRAGDPYFRFLVGPRNVRFRIPPIKETADEPNGEFVVGRPPVGGFAARSREPRPSPGHGGMPKWKRKMKEREDSKEMFIRKWDRLEDIRIHKGTPSTTVFRTRDPNAAPPASETTTDFLRRIEAERCAGPSTAPKPPAPKSTKSPLITELKSSPPKVAEIKTPKFTIVHRALRVDYQQCLEERERQGGARPDALVVRVELPGVTSAAEVDLEPKEKCIELTVPKKMTSRPLFGD